MRNPSVLGYQRRLPESNRWKVPVGNRLDPEDGQCDSHSAETIGVCQCGRDLAWMQVKIAALATAALGGDDDDA